MSYSRVDQALVRRVYDALTAQGREVWVDWEAIRPSAEWYAEIERGIRSVNSFVFLISPDSVDSEVCRRELELAEALNKRLVPVLVRDTSTADIPAALRRHNWVFLRDEDDFAAGVSGLVQALDTDIDWLHAHTEQLLQALAWTDAGQDKSRLLKGMALQQAEAWLAQAAGKDPPPGAEQLAHIQASRRAATRRLRWLVASTATGMAVALVLTAWALFASYAAQLARDEAVARRLGAEASLVATERDALIERSALLAIESWRRSPSLQNDVPLRRALALLPSPVAGWGVWTEPVDAAVPLGNGGGVAFAVSERPGKAVVKIARPGNETPRTLPHASRVRALASCADGRWVATLTARGRVFLWDLATTAGATLLAHEPHATQIHCTDDGDLLAVGSRSGQVELFRASEGRRVRVLDEPLEAAVRSLAFDPKTQRVAAGGERLLRVWDVASGAVLATKAHGNPVVDIAFDPQGLQIAAASGPWAYLWALNDSASHKRLQHQTNVHAVAFSHSGRRIATACGDYRAHVWNAETQRRIGHLRHQGPVTAVAFSRDDRYILTASNDDTARLWWAASGAEAQRFAHNRSMAAAGTTPFVVAARFDAAGDRIVTAGRDGRVRLWDIAPANATVHLGKARYGNGRRWSADARYRLEKIARTRWELRNALNRQTVLAFDSEGGIVDFAVGPHAKIVVMSTFDRRVRVMQIAGGQVLRDIALPAVADTVSIHPDGHSLLTGSRDKLLRLWSLRDGRLLWERLHDGNIMSGGFSPDGELAASGATDGFARVWQVNDGTALGQFKHPHDVKGVVFSPDGQNLATACSDGAARIWELASDRAPRYLRHQFPVESIAYSPDGGRLLTGSTDNTVRVWTPDRGLEQSRIDVRDGVQRVSFIDDSRFLVAAGRTLSIHGVGGHALVAKACGRLTRNLSQIEWLEYLGSEAYRATCPE